MAYLRRALRTWVQSAVDPAVVSKVGDPILARLNRSPTTTSLGQAKKILVIRLDGIGDVLMTSPFLRELRRCAPQAEITLVVKPPSVPLMELCPYVNQVLGFDPRVYSPRYGGLLRQARTLRFHRTYVWGKQFDLAIVPRWDTYFDHEPFLAYLSGIPNRVGFSENVSPTKQRANAGVDRLFTRVVHDAVYRHEVEYSLHLLRELGGTVESDELELWLSSADERTAERFLKAQGVSGQDLLIGICPGASLPRRIWPVERFIEVAKSLRKKWGARILVLGGPGEAPQAGKFQASLGKDFLNAQKENFSIRETAALLKRCRLYFGNNTGPMHLAAAFKVPIVELSCHAASDKSHNDNSPERFQAWKSPNRVLQPLNPLLPCQGSCSQNVAHCILGIEATDALAECDRFIEGPLRPRG